MKKQQPVKSADDRLRDQLSTAKSAVQAKARIIAAQQGEIEQMRAMLVELTAPKPGRAFRTRKLIVDRLDVTIKGTDITEDEVLIEHVGGYLAIRVGDAIGFTAGAPPSREAYRFTPEVPQQQATATVARPAENLMLGTLRSLGVGSIAAVDPTGGAGDDPSIVNAALAPQGDPRVPGGYQLAAEREVVQTYGYTGTGQQPKGWADPDAVKADPAN